MTLICQKCISTIDCEYICATIFKVIILKNYRLFIFNITNNKLCIVNFMVSWE